MSPISWGYIGYELFAAVAPTDCIQNDLWHQPSLKRTFHLFSQVISSAAEEQASQLEF